MRSPHFNRDSQKNDLDLQACNWNKLETKEELIQATWRDHRAAVYSMLLKKKNHVSWKQRTPLQAPSNLHKCLYHDFFLFMGPKFLIKY